MREGAALTELRFFPAGGLLRIRWDQPIQPFSVINPADFWIVTSGVIRRGTSGGITGSNQITITMSSTPIADPGPERTGFEPTISSLIFDPGGQIPPYGPLPYI